MRVEQFTPTYAVTGATNATPIVITTATHDLQNSDTVIIRDVGGNTAANGRWTLANRTATTFELVGSIGNGTYTSGGEVEQTNHTGGHAGDISTIGKIFYPRATEGSSGVLIGNSVTALEDLNKEMLFQVHARSNPENAWCSVHQIAEGDPTSAANVGATGFCQTKTSVVIFPIMRIVHVGTASSTNSGHCCMAWPEGAHRG